MKAKAILNLTFLLGLTSILPAGAIPAPTGPPIALYNSGTGGGLGCIGTATLTAGCALAPHGFRLAPWQTTEAPVGGSYQLEAVQTISGVYGGTHSWLAPNSTSTWYSPTPTNPAAPAADLTGDYKYQLQFNLTAAQAASTAVIEGQWAADDQASMLLNGNVVSFIPKGVSSFKNWTPFTIDFGFQPGLNTLELQIRNMSAQSGANGFAGAKTATGFRVEFASVFVPEGGELAALTLGLGAVLFAWKRKKSALVPTL